MQYGAVFTDEAVFCCHVSCARDRPKSQGASASMMRIRPAFTTSTSLYLSPKLSLSFPSSLNDLLSP